MNESDPVPIEDGESFDIDDAVYRGRCGDCYDPDEGQYENTGKLSFRLDPDPDSLRYTADCPDCGDHYELRPTEVTAFRYM